MSVKLKSLERKMGLVPKQYAPMSPGMQQLARQSDRAAEKAPAPVESSDLGTALEQAIQSTVDQRIEEALEQQRQRLLLDQQFKPAPVQPPPTERKRPTSISTVVHRRDRFGRIFQLLTTAEGSDRQLLTEVTRDGLGSIISSRTVPLDKGYVPGEPR